MITFLKSFSLFILILLLFILLLVLLGNNKLNKGLKMLHSSESKMIYDKDLGYRLKRNEHFSWNLISQNSADTLIKITTDSLQRRVVYNQKDSEKHLIVLGCSYTFGQGLKDEETIPFLISKNSEYFQVYNYTMAGYGAQHIIPILENPIEEEISQDSGILLYFFIEHHLNRLVRDFFSIPFTCFTPYFVEDNNNNIVNKGAFYKEKPIITRFVLGLSHFPKLYRAGKSLELLFRQIETPQNYEFLAKVVSKSRDVYLSKFPKGKYFVVVFPGESITVKEYLEAEGISVLDLSESVDFEKINGRQSDGYHPNEKGAAAVAEVTLEFLNTL